MSVFIDLVLSAYDPNSPANEAAQSELILMKNTDSNTFVNLICESLQIANLDEKTIILLLILSREAFSSSNSNELDETNTFNVSPEISSTYESILISEMNSQNKDVRFHSSMSFGHFAYFFILRDSTFLTHIFDLFNSSEPSQDFIISFETSLLYILEQMSFGADQTKEISTFIFTRLNIDDSLINERILCLKILLQISPNFLSFYTEEEKNDIWQIMKQYSMIPELSYYSFTIWSNIADKNPELINSSLFNEIMEISIQIVSLTEDESNSANFNVNNPSMIELTKFEIFKFWDFSIYSNNSEIISQMLPYMPKLTEFGIKNLFIPDMDDENNNIATDCASALISSIILSFPKESMELFESFIQSNYQNPSNIENQTDYSISLFDFKNQYDSFVLVLLFLKTEVASYFLDISIEMIQIGFDSPLNQFTILALNTISQITQFDNIDQIASQIDFTTFLPICLNFLNTEIQQIQDESVRTISDILAVIYQIDDDRPNTYSKLSNYENFEIMDFLNEIMNLIQSNASFTQVIYLLSIVNNAIEYVSDFESIYLIFQFTCQLLKHQTEVNPNDCSISSSCEVISTILKKETDGTFPSDEMQQLFELLLNLRTTENGDSAIYTIGFIASKLKDEFTPMLEETINTALEFIDNETFVRPSIKCIQMVILFCNSGPAIEEIIRRLFHILSDENSSDFDYLISFETIKVIVIVYYNLLAESSETENDILEMIAGYLNAAVQSLVDMDGNDEETSMRIAYIVFEIYCMLIKKNIKKFFRSISNSFFILASTIIASYNGNDEIPIKFSGLLIDIVNFFAECFGSSLYEMLKKSHILDFLLKLLEIYKDDEGSNVKNSIEHILSIVCKEQQ